MNFSFPGREVLSQCILELMQLIDPVSDLATSSTKPEIEYSAQKLLVGPEDEVL